MRNEQPDYGITEADVDIMNAGRSSSYDHSNPNEDAWNEEAIEAAEATGEEYLKPRAAIELDRLREMASRAKFKPNASKKQIEEIKAARGELTDEVNGEIAAFVRGEIKDGIVQGDAVRELRWRRDAIPTAQHLANRLALASNPRWSLASAIQDYIISEAILEGHCQLSFKNIADIFGSTIDKVRYAIREIRKNDYRGLLDITPTSKGVAACVRINLIPAFAVGDHRNVSRALDAAGIGVMAKDTETETGRKQTDEDTDRLRNGSKKPKSMGTHSHTPDADLDETKGMRSRSQDAALRERSTVVEEGLRERSTVVRGVISINERANNKKRAGSSDGAPSDEDEIKRTDEDDVGNDRSPKPSPSPVGNGHQTNADIPPSPSSVPVAPTSTKFAASVTAATTQSPRPPFPGEGSRPTGREVGPVKAPPMDGEIFGPGEAVAAMSTELSLVGGEARTRLTDDANVTRALTHCGITNPSEAQVLCVRDAMMKARIQWEEMDEDKNGRRHRRYKSELTWFLAEWVPRLHADLAARRHLG